MRFHGGLPKPRLFIELGTLCFGMSGPPEGLCEAITLDGSCVLTFIKFTSLLQIPTYIAFVAE